MKPPLSFKKQAYLGKVRHKSAPFRSSSRLIISPVTHPLNIAFPEVNGVQHSANNGEDGSNYVHQHSEAHLRGKTPLFFGHCSNKVYV